MQEPLDSSSYQQITFSTPICKRDPQYFHKLTARNSLQPEVATRSAEPCVSKNKLTFVNVLQNIYRVDGKDINPTRTVMGEMNSQYQQRHLNRNMSWDSLGYFSDEKENREDGDEAAGEPHWRYFGKRISEVEYCEVDGNEEQECTREELNSEKYVITEPVVSAFAMAIETYSYEGSEAGDNKEQPQLNQIQYEGQIIEKSCQQQEKDKVHFQSPKDGQQVPVPSDDPQSEMKSLLCCPITPSATPSSPRSPTQPLSPSSFLWLRQLGKGYLGEVFLAVHKLTGFVCALKVITKQSILRQNVMQQILRELSIHWSCKHPNIASMYGFFWDDEKLYVMQELCTDGELFALIKRRHRVEEQEAKYLLKQVVEAVRYMHVNCIMHRDIKPENILLQYGVVKISDFGWAVQSACVRNSRCVGTPLYMAPELVKAEPHDQRVDNWAIGMLAYQLLIGHLPFWICCEMDLMKIVNDEVKFTSFVDISDLAKDFILQGLEKDPKKRIGMLDMLIHPFVKEAHEYQNLLL